MRANNGGLFEMEAKARQLDDIQTKYERERAENYIEGDDKEMKTKLKVDVEITTNKKGDRCFSDDNMECCRFLSSIKYCKLFEDDVVDGRCEKCKQAELKTKEEKK